MAVKARGGMYCEHCDKPIAAQKQAFNNNEYWHCPTCGERAVTVKKHQRSAAKKQTASTLAKEQRENPGAFAAVKILARPTPKAGPLEAARNVPIFLAVQAATGWSTEKISSALTQLPFTISGLKPDAAEQLVSKLSSKGLTAEYIAPADEDAAAKTGAAVRIFELPPDPGKKSMSGTILGHMSVKDTIRNGARWTPAQTDVFLKLKLPSIVTGLEVEHAKRFATALQSKGVKAEFLPPGAPELTPLPDAGPSSPSAPAPAPEPESAPPPHTDTPGIPDAAPSSPGAPDIPAQIERLGELRDANLITEEEFAQKKTELLSRI
jgi:predicted RNA-binding Zn-ribbon protein involved in translation (DUF1610 family)